MSLLNDTNVKLLATACTHNDTLSNYTYIIPGYDTYNVGCSVSKPFSCEFSDGISNITFSFVKDDDITIWNNFLKGYNYLHCGFLKSGSATIWDQGGSDNYIKFEVPITKCFFVEIVNYKKVNNYHQYNYSIYTYKNNSYSLVKQATINWDNSNHHVPCFHLTFTSESNFVNMRSYYSTNSFTIDMANILKDNNIVLYKDKNMYSPYYQEGYSGKMTLSKYGVYVPGELIENKTAYKFTKTGNIEASEFIEY